MTQTPDVVILLALCDAGPLLSAQLHSFAAQTHTDWRLIVSDDGKGSRDPDGPAELQQFTAAQPQRQISLVPGPRQGFARNFLHLIQAVDAGPRFVALSDHDDVWLPEKLAKAVRALAAVPAGQPALYCARTLICDADLKPAKASPIWSKPFGFRNALVQNVAAGNTIVLNRAALELAQQASAAAIAANIIAHDWWLYLIVTAVGGRVIRDDSPVLLYRQHARNQMGRNDTVAAGFARTRQIMAGEFRSWIDRNLAALRPLEPLMTAENRAVLHEFSALRAGALWPRLRRFARLGIYRQTRFGGAVVWLALMLAKL
jgi:glycosyltransferase involved in cell wall biosynthesis